jgi:hypothetical protein
MLLRRNLTVALLALLYIQCTAQSEKPSPRERIFVGGNFGLQFGSITEIDVNPQIGYRLTPRLSAGIGVSYEYYNDGAYNNINTSIYGGSIFARYTLIKNLGEVLPVNSRLSFYGQVEDEVLSLENKYFSLSGSTTGRFFQNSVLVGGGIKQPISDRASFFITVLWNLNETPESIYTNPVVRFGFVIGLGPGRNDNGPQGL